MIKIRNFELIDLPEVSKIAEISFPKNKISSKTFKKYFQEYPDYFFVSEEMGEITGYLVAKLNTNIAEIVSIAVKPNSQRKGTGRKLVEFLFENLKKIGIKEILLHIRPTNETGLSFFQNLNFRILSTVKKYYQNKEDAFLMARSI